MRLYVLCTLPSMTNLTRPLVTYGKRQRRSPALASTQFQAVARSPRSCLGSERHESVHEASRSGLCKPMPDMSATTALAYDGDIVRPSACATTTASSSSAIDDRNTQGAALRDIGQSRPRRKRLFQLEQSKIVRSSADRTKQADATEELQDDELRCFYSQSSKITKARSLELTDHPYASPASNGSSGGAHLTCRTRNATASATELCSSTPTRSVPGQPSGVLRRKLYSCTLRDIPLQHLQARKHNRAAKRAIPKDPLIPIGDGFEITERLVQLPPILITRRRGAAKPRPSCCRQLILVAISPHDANQSLQSLRSQARRSCPNTTADHSNQYQQHNGLPIFDDDLPSVVDETLSCLNDETLQLFQRISAPVRPGTPATEPTADSNPSESQPSVDVSSETDDADSWSGLASPESELLEANPASGLEALYRRKTMLSLGSMSPVSDLLSSSDTFASLDDWTATAGDSCHIVETNPRTYRSSQSLNRGPDIQSMFGRSSRQVEIWNSEGAVLETSQPTK